MTQQPPYATASDRILYNWSGLQYIARKDSVAHPRDETELADLIKRAQHVRVIGSALSYEPINSLRPDRWHPSHSPIADGGHLLREDCPGSVVISLQRHFTGLVSVDKLRRTATFRAATSIDQVIHTLALHGHMMTACPGVIGIQTLAGSIATGTHGQGLYQSDYADMVQSFKVVLANGRIRKMTPADPEFHLYLISMGIFGVLTEIEISIRPRLLYTCMKLSCTYSDFLENYKIWNEQNELCKVWWFPKTSIVQVWLVNPSTENEIAYYLHRNKMSLHQFSHLRSEHSEHDYPGQHHSDDPEPVEIPTDRIHQEMDKTVRDYIQAMADDTQVSQKSGEPQFTTLTRFMNMQKVIGFIEQLVTKGIPVPQINCEIAVPFEKFQAATRALERWNDANPGRLHYPFIYRISGPSKALLSASHRGPVVWIGFLVYISQSGSVRDDGMTTMHLLQKALAPFDGLPHWGKHFHPELFSFEKHYGSDTWSRFRQEIQKIDPGGKFISPFLRQIFLAEERNRSTDRSCSSSSVIKSKL